MSSQMQMRSRSRQPEASQRASRQIFSDAIDVSGIHGHQIWPPNLEAIRTRGSCWREAPMYLYPMKQRETALLAPGPGRKGRGPAPPSPSRHQRGPARRSPPSSKRVCMVCDTSDTVALTELTLSITPCSRRRAPRAGWLPFPPPPPPSTGSQLPAAGPVVHAPSLSARRLRRRRRRDRVHAGAEMRMPPTTPSNSKGSPKRKLVHESEDAIPSNTPGSCGAMLRASRYANPRLGGRHPGEQGVRGKRPTPPGECGAGTQGDANKETGEEGPHLPIANSPPPPHLLVEAGHHSECLQVPHHHEEGPRRHHGAQGRAWGRETWETGGA